MKNKIIILLVLSAIFSAQASNRSTDLFPDKTFPDQYTPEDKIYAFSTVWSELKYNFVHIDRIGFDPDSLYRSFIPRVLQTANDVEFFELLNKFIARFNDGHTTVGGYSYRWNDVYDYAPMLFEELDGRFYVSRLWESSGLDSLALGAELILIEDVPAQEYVKDHYLSSIAHGSMQAKLSVAASGFIGTGVPGSYFQGILKLRDGMQTSFKLCNNYNQLDKDKKNGRMWYWKGIRKPRRSDVTLEWLDDEIAWMDFRSFNIESIPLIDKLMEQVRHQATGLIIDLRNCPGGASPVGDYLLKYIVDADYFLSGASQTRVANGYKRSQGNWRPEYEDFYMDRAYETIPADTIRIERSEVLKCPVVILVDKYTASAAETFLIQLKDIPERPKIIGRKTEGSTGAPLVIDLPYGAWVKICTLRHIFPISGESFDNQGIYPDEIVTPTVDDYLSGYDAAMKSALRAVKAQK